jgi:hypothetical protein
MRTLLSMSRSGARDGLAKFRERLRRAWRAVEDFETTEPVATPPPGARSNRFGDLDAETSTNAQMEGEADAPWGGNR